jgi:hypothetical protein
MSRFLQLLFFYFFQIIEAPFPKEAKNKEENMESPNSHAIVEVGLDEISLTLGFDFEMFQAKDIELPNSRAVVVISLDGIPLILNVDPEMPCSLMEEVNPFHVIFDLNGVLIATHFNRGFCIIILYLGILGEMPCSIPSLYLCYILMSQYI